MGLPKLDTKGETKVQFYKSRLNDVDWGVPNSSETYHVNEYLSTGWIGQLNLDMVLSIAIDERVSDVHITTNQRIAFTKNGDIQFRNDFSIPDSKTTDDYSQEVLSEVQYSEFLPFKSSDFSYEVRIGPMEGERFRGHIGFSKGQIYFVFRHLSNKIPSLVSLGVEDELVDWINNPEGLILVCGSTGTGKSTTLASLIRHVQLTQYRKIVTVERPIEYIYPDDGKSLVTQREVGEDVNSFLDGLTDAMREAPDILLLGEVRVAEEVNEWIRAGESGHLGLSTMHTNNVATTINRIQGLFTGAERARILSTLAENSIGFMNQVLVKDNYDGRFACREILSINDEIRDLISKGDTKGIYRYQMEHKITMEHKLVESVHDGRATLENAFAQSSRRQAFNEIAKEMGVI